MYREIVPFVLECIFTFGIRFFVWIYQVTNQLNEKCEEKIGNVGLRTFFCMICPLYTMWWFSQTARRVDSLQDETGETSNLTMLCTIYAGFGGYYLAAVLIQKRLNRLERGPEPIAEYPDAMTRSETQKMFVPVNEIAIRMVVTLNIYNLYWVWRMTGYLNGVAGFSRRDPNRTVLLCLFCPPYLLYWIYETARRMESLCKEKELSAPNLTGLCCIYSCLTVLILPACLIQKKLNQIILKEYEAEHGSLHSKYDRVTRENTIYYMFRFNRMEELRTHTDWNWISFFFGAYWLFYRRMYAWGLFSFFLDFASIFAFIQGLYFNTLSFAAAGLALLFASRLLLGVFSNDLYKNRCDTLLQQEMQIEKESDKPLFLAKKGGVSASAFCLSLILTLILLGCVSVLLAEEVQMKFVSAQMYNNGIFDTSYDTDIDPYFFRQEAEGLQPSEKEELYKEQAAAEEKAKAERTEKEAALERLYQRRRMFRLLWESRHASD